MNCHTCQQLITKWRFRKLTEQENKEMIAHMVTCQTCAELYAIENWLIALAKNETKEQVSPDMPDRIMEGIMGTKENLQQSKQLHNLRWTILLRTAAAVLLMLIAVAAGVFMGNLNRLSRQMPEEMALLNDANLESFSFYNETHTFWQTQKSDK